MTSSGANLSVGRVRHLARLLVGVPGLGLGVNLGEVGRLGRGSRVSLGLLLSRVDAGLEWVRGLGCCGHALASTQAGGRDGTPFPGLGGRSTHTISTSAIGGLGVAAVAGCPGPLNPPHLPETSPAVLTAGVGGGLTPWAAGHARSAVQNGARW